MIFKPLSRNAFSPPLISGSCLIATESAPIPGVVDTAGSMFLSGTDNLDSRRTFSSSGLNSTEQFRHQKDVLFIPASVSLINVWLHMLQI